LAAILPFSTGAGQAQGFGHRTPETAAQARVAAQRAFFQAALGRTSAPAAVTREANAQAPSSTSTAQDPSMPDRIPRPGSLVNIVV
jgi:hypothetical protein